MTLDIDLSHSGALPLGPDMTISQAAAHQRTLLQALPHLATDPRVDLSAVTEFDSSGVQLLMALKSSLAQREQVLQLVNAPAVVRDALEVFGLQAAFAYTGTEAH